MCFHKSTHITLRFECKLSKHMMPLALMYKQWKGLLIYLLARFLCFSKCKTISLKHSSSHLLLSPLAPQCVAWHSEDKPFAVGYPDGKIVLATTEGYENEQPVVLSIFLVCL